VARTCLSPKAWVLLWTSHEPGPALGSEAESTWQRLASTAEWLRGASCHSEVIVAAAPPPPAPRPGEALGEALSRSAAAASAELSALNSSARGGTVFADCSHILHEGGPELVTVDGARPSPEGYGRLAECLLPRLDAAARRPKPHYWTNAPPDGEVKAQSTVHSRYGWAYSAWACDAACGHGLATRNESCVEASTGAAVDPQRCDPGQREPVNSQCNRGDCPQMAWVAGRWGPCDKKCGGGVAIRTVECISSQNEVMDNALCQQSSEPRPLAWTRCNTSPCPLLLTKEVDKKAYYEDYWGSSMREQLGLSSMSALTADSGNMSGLSSGHGHSQPGSGPSTNESGKSKPMANASGVPDARDSRGGVTIMAGSSDDSGSLSRRASAASEAPEPSSDNGNGEEYVRKSLKELLVCYGDSDCGPGYECEPFTCSKACKIYTNRQMVSEKLRHRYLPEPPSFVYQGMYQSMIFGGTGGICYRRCHHMTKCSRRADDGTCRDWYCRKVEGCHNFPGDFHVPSLEECGVNGLCKPGNCRRKADKYSPGMAAASNSNPSVSSSAHPGSGASPSSVSSEADVRAMGGMTAVGLNLCVGGAVPSVSGCCLSGVVSANGTCCAMGSVVDLHGHCCPADAMDCCGVCGGLNKSVDILGRCCTSELDANGICCPVDRKVDECGICGGWNGSCAVVMVYSMSAASLMDLEYRSHSEFPQRLADSTAGIGIDANAVEVVNLTIDSFGERDDGSVNAHVTYQIMPSSAGMFAGLGALASRTADIGNRLSMRRAAICGNGMCETGEQTRDGWEGTCPEDCAWSGFVPCECSGHGICTPATGSCECHRGYTGSECSFCDHGYISVGDDADSGSALCVEWKAAGNLSTAVVYERQERQSVPWDAVPEGLLLNESEQVLGEVHGQQPGLALRVALTAGATLLLIGLAFACMAQLRRRSPHRRRRRGQQARETVSPETIHWNPPWSTGDDPAEPPTGAAPPKLSGDSPPPASETSVQHFEQSGEESRQH